MFDENLKQYLLTGVGDPQKIISGIVQEERKNTARELESYVQHGLAGPFAMYQLYPMTREQATQKLVHDLPKGIAAALLIYFLTGEPLSSLVVALFVMAFYFNKDNESKNQYRDMAERFRGITSQLQS